MSTRQLIEFLLLLLISCLFVWTFYLAPNWEAISNIQTEIEGIKNQQALFTQQIKKLKDIGPQLDKIRTQLEAKKQSMRNSSPTLILAFCEQSSQQAGLKLHSFQPGKKIIKDFYSQKEITLILTGSFQGHMNFLREFRQVKDILSLQTINLQDTGTDAGLRMQVVFLAYSLSPLEKERK